MEEEEGDREGGLGMRSKGGGAKREGWEDDNAALDDGHEDEDEDEDEGEDYEGRPRQRRQRRRY